MPTKKQTAKRPNSRFHRKTQRLGLSPLSKSFIATLKRKYTNCMFDKENNNEKYKGHHITYGEMTYEGLEKLQRDVFAHYLPVGSNIVFMDIGMGRGKLPLFMSSNPRVCKSIGVELVKERFDYANELKTSLEKANGKYKQFTHKIHFSNEDILNENLGEMTEHKPCFIWISNLCFDQKLTDKIFDKLHGEIHRDSIICCSKNPEQKTGVVLKKQMIVPMSWCETSNVFIFGFEK